MNMTLEDIARRLNCTSSKVSWLLKNGTLHGVKKNGQWIVTDDDISDFLHREKGKKQPQIVLRTGDTFGFWTVIEPDLYNKHGQRAALCQCVCGKQQLIAVIRLIQGKTKSCGCKRHLGMTPMQKEGFTNGQKVMKQIHDEHLVAGLPYALSKNSTTGHKGVSYMPKYGTYRAYITVNRKQIHLGTFANIDDAIAARKAAEDRYFKPLQERVKALKAKFKENGPEKTN